MGQVKGTAVQASLRGARERFGEGALARVIEARPEADRAAIGNGALASSWYGRDGFLRLMQEAERQLRTDEPDVVRTGFGGGAPQFCDRIFGWMQRTLELAGAKDLRSAHSACVHRGDPVCRFEGTWD